MDKDHVVKHDHGHNRRVSLAMLAKHKRMMFDHNWPMHMGQGLLVYPLMYCVCVCVCVCLCLCVLSTCHCFFVNDSPQFASLASR